MEKSFKSSTAQNHRTLPAPLEETVVRGRGRPRKRIQELLFLGKARAGKLPSSSWDWSWLDPPPPNPHPFTITCGWALNTKAPVGSPSLLSSHFLLPAGTVLKIYQRLKSTAAKTKYIQLTNQDLNCTSIVNNHLLASVRLDPWSYLITWRAAGPNTGTEANPHPLAEQQRAWNNWVPILAWLLTA